MPVPRKRATVLWDTSLEDVLEDDDEEMEEQHSMSREEAVQKHEDNEVRIGKEKYMVCTRATLRISGAWSLEGRYCSPSFPHLIPIFFFFLIALILPKSSVKN